MDIRSLAKIDLNLLISLQVMLEEQNVSRTAERLFISQPAMSKTLSRLREVFADPLFIRSSHGMQPTPRALELQVELEPILRNIQHLVATHQFDPARYKGKITIALSEYVGIGLLPPLMARLQHAAPGLTVQTITRVENQLEELASGNLDLAIHIKQVNYKEDFICESIGSNPPVILAREGHPLTGQDITWEKIAAYPLIRLYIADLEQLALFQAEGGFGQVQQESEGSFETSHLLTALEVLRNTDFLMPGPPFARRNPTVGYKIQAIPFPHEITYELEYMLVRHRRTEKSALHNWLWEEVLTVVEQLRAQAQTDMA
jgi:DNA-binding transcriptional LysR family regulator